MLQYVQRCFQQYVGFTGRARRSEYWCFVLFNFLIYALLLTLGTIMVVRDNTIAGGVLYAIFYLYSLAVFLPNLAVSVRRMHDIGKGGGWIFISFVPLVGVIWYLVLLCTAGEAGENRFGKDPKRTEEEEQEEYTRMC